MAVAASRAAGARRPCAGLNPAGTGLVLPRGPGYTAAMRRSSMLLAPMALLFALLLAACGNKGPLVYAPAPDDEDVEAVEDVVEP